MHHDILAIGASAGGIEVLLDLVSELPGSLQASVFVTVHSPAGYRSELPQLLTSRGHFPATHPVHHEEIRRGRVYVAPPDNQLLVRDGFVEVVRGPRENGHRPAVDPMFRTAAVTYGERVVGVVLSGYQDCGTAGLMAIKANGGTTVAQSPESALAPEMPRNAIERVGVDHVATPMQLPALLERLVGEPVPARSSPRIGADEPARVAEVVCPSCHGVLKEHASGAVHDFRCHVGHAFTLDGLARAQNDELERALWAAVRSLEESAALAKRLAGSEKREAMRARFVDRARTLRHEAELIRNVLLYGKASIAHDDEGSEESEGSA